MLHEDQPAEVFVTGNEKTAFLTRAGQQIAVGSASQVEFSGSDDIVAEVAEKAGGQRVNVLVEQESHEAALTWMSSVWTTSMAY